MFRATDDQDQRRHSNEALSRILYRTSVIVEKDGHPDYESKPRTFLGNHLLTAHLAFLLGR